MRQRDVAGAPEVSRLAVCTASPQPSPTRQLDHCACREAVMIASLKAHRSIVPVDDRLDSTSLYQNSYRRPWKDAALLRCLQWTATFPGCQTQALVDVSR